MPHNLVIAIRAAVLVLVVSVASINRGTLHDGHRRGRLRTRLTRSLCDDDNDAFITKVDTKVDTT